ncbi:MAG: oxidoreductase, partial [Flavobacteriaceae bacterium]|nr:oxidoreductase [Flavobacteriaceae bacterium]
LIVFNSCYKDTIISSVEINPILIDSEINIRALEIKNNRVYSATSNGSILNFDIDKSDVISEINYEFENDSIVPNFRSLAVTENDVFAMSIGNPALLFKNGKVVYKESHPKVFYDSIEFWNEDEGIAVGDFTDNCISILITRDGGESWNKLDCSVFNNVKESEGFFAASDTNISIVNNKVWLASGGVNSRIYFSDDKGKSWKIIDTPIVQGESTTGIFSIDFYDEYNGFAIGGDYTKPSKNTSNKIVTSNGGNTWKVVANNKDPGYRSCVQYFPNSRGNSLVAVGFDGIDISNDRGNTWEHVSDESFYTIRFLDEITAYAAGDGKISKLHFK